MAEQKRSARSKGVPHHPLVEALASDPNQPPKPATRLFGFPGPAADSKSTRLWLDEELSSYVDVPDEAILHSQTLAEDRGTLLWVDPAATLTHGASGAQEVQAEFLGGAIAQRNLAGAPAPAPGALEATIATVCTRTQTQLTLARTICNPTEGPPCGPSFNVPCVSKWIVCISVNIPCQTEPVVCDPIRTLRCITVGVPCIEPTQVASVGGGFCPPWTDTRTINTTIVNPTITEQIGPFRPLQ
jgi:hypothetical protein